MLRTIIALYLLCVCQFTIVAQSIFEFQISGRIKNIGDDTLTLTLPNAEAPKNPFQYSILVKNDSFHFKSQSTKVDQAYLSNLTKRNLGEISFFIEPGKIYINGESPELSKARVTGTQSNEEYAKLKSIEKPYSDEMMKLRNELKLNPSVA